MAVEKMVIVKTFPTRIEAEIAAGLLKANNIASVIQADDQGGQTPFPFSPTTSPVKLLVNQKDFQKAEDLLKK